MCERSCIFEDTLSVRDCKRYIDLPFDVPEGTSRLRIDLRYEPLHLSGRKEIKNMLGITLLDPGGFRGGLLNDANHKVAEITPLRATPGFGAGPLPVGRWLLELDVFLVMPGAPLEYRAEIRLASGAQAEATASRPGASPSQGAQRSIWPRPPVKRQAGWYRGDLHTHTVHSDGQLTVGQLVDLARECGLDFMALTDHNTVAQLDDPDLQGCRDLAIVPGMELTTHYGHALALGTRHWIDWRTGHSGRTMGEALAEIKAAGGLSVLAHLASLSDPVCTGCGWLYTDQMPGSVTTIEVWNGPWFGMGVNNPTTLHIWKQWLQAGHRLPAVAGTDVHGPNEYRRRQPFNLVYARELSAEGILEGVAGGHVMLSSGPELYLEATLAGGGIAIMGDAVAVEEIDAMAVRWRGAPQGAQVHWVSGGQVVAIWAGQEGEARPAPPVGAHWALAELRGADGELLALTNPLYFAKNARD